MAAYAINLIAEENSDFDTTLTITDSDNGLPMNLAGYTGQAKIKRSFRSSTFYSFTLEFVDRVAGVVRLSLDADDVPAGRYVYDVILTSPNGTKIRVVDGLLEVSPGVT